MFNPTELLSLALLKRFVPAYRFIRAQAAIINEIEKAENDCFAQPKFQLELNPTSIKVLNWNVAKKSHEQDWTRDFLTILTQYKPDLIFLQEACLRTETKQAIGLAEMSWHFAPNFIDTYHNMYAGVLTAAKVKPLNSRSILSQHYEPVTKTPKISLITEYSLGNQSQTLLVVNTHFINFVTLSKFQSQLSELEAAIGQHQGPVIFSGDFNTWSYSRSWLLQVMADRLGLTQASFSFSDRKKIKRFLLSPPLDYIFYRGLSEKAANARVLDHIVSSDHKPMLAEFFY